MAGSRDPDKLYRIMDFSKVIKIFESESLYFANPAGWDDPYERRVQHPYDHALFAQCWSTHGRSDALWRIYSKHGLGVRISTTPSKFRAALRKAAKEADLEYRFAKVSYISQTEFNKNARLITKEMNLGYDINRVVELLYMKRAAFRHESEWRATIYSSANRTGDSVKGLPVPIEPHEFIEDILLDPQAPEELTSAFEFYLKKKINFKGKVNKSVLYKTPRVLKIDGGYVSEDV